MSSNLSSYTTLTLTEGYSKVFRHALLKSKFTQKYFPKNGDIYIIS